MAISRRALTTFTQQALNDGNQAISLLNSEVSIMRKAVLRNCMALDILSAPQGGTCATIQTERCVFIPDESFNVTHLMNHMKNQISALSDPFSSLNNLLRNWLGVRGSWLKYLLIIPPMLLAVLHVFCQIICLHSHSSGNQGSSRGPQPLRSNA